MSTPFSSGAFGAGVKPPQESNLAGVVDVVEGHTEDHRPGNLTRRRAQQIRDSLAQLAMLLVEQGAIPPPRLFGQYAWPSKPVASGQGERPLRLAAERFFSVARVGCIENKALTELPGRGIAGRSGLTHKINNFRWVFQQLLGLRRFLTYPDSTR